MRRKVYLETFPPTFALQAALEPLGAPFSPRLALPMIAEAT